MRVDRRFQFEAPAQLIAWDCDCSICAMKRNTHAIVPGSAFKLLQGSEDLSLYQFGTKTAKHLFCKVRAALDAAAVRASCAGAQAHAHTSTSHTACAHAGVRRVSLLRATVKPRRVSACHCIARAMLQHRISKRRR